MWERCKPEAFFTNLTSYIHPLHDDVPDALVCDPGAIWRQGELLSIMEEEAGSTRAVHRSVVESSGVTRRRESELRQSPGESFHCPSVQSHVLSQSVMSDSLQPPRCSPAGSSVHGGAPSTNTGGDCRLLLQIFLTQGLNLRLLFLLHWQADIFLPLHHLGSALCPRFSTKSQARERVPTVTDVLAPRGHAATDRAATPGTSSVKSQGGWQHLELR